MEIVEYEKKYQPDFKRLNMEWLEGYDLLETHDLEILDDPDGLVIDTGGCIFLIKENDAVIGTAGLWKEDATTYELIKMAVDKQYQGRGLSRILMDLCLDKAKALNAKKVFLYSNSKLTTALNLYKKYGFKHIPNLDSPFVTADVKMELLIAE
ncbi:MAG: GNAT family N-acetyltransferase [Ferruginibacter sp.]